MSYNLSLSTTDEFKILSFDVSTRYDCPHLFEGTFFFKRWGQSWTKHGSKKLACWWWGRDYNSNNGPASTQKTLLYTFQLTNFQVFYENVHANLNFNQFAMVAGMVLLALRIENCFPRRNFENATIGFVLELVFIFILPQGEDKQLKECGLIWWSIGPYQKLISLSKYRQFNLAATRYPLHKVTFGESDLLSWMQCIVYWYMLLASRAPLCFKAN